MGRRFREQVPVKVPPAGALSESYSDAFRAWRHTPLVPVQAPCPGGFREQVPVHAPGWSTPAGAECLPLRVGMCRYVERRRRLLERGAHA